MKHKAFIQRNSATVLAIAGAVGVVATVVTTTRAAPKAIVIKVWLLVQKIMDCTCGYSQKRGTLYLIEAEDIREIFDEIESSPVMETLWKTYQKNYSYAADISWHTIMKSICALYGSILENMYDA